MEQANAASFGELFGSLQLVLSKRQTLAIVKIFDPVKQYPTRSILGTLNLLDSNAELWRVHKRWRLHQVLIETGLDNSRVEDMSNAELTRAVVARFRNTLPDPKRVSPDNPSLSLNILRQSRDKTIAHNEAIESRLLSRYRRGEKLTH
jgi:hypothetical protein